MLKKLLSLFKKSMTKKIGEEEYRARKKFIQSYLSDLQKLNHERAIEKFEEDKRIVAEKNDICPVCGNKVGIINVYHDYKGEESKRFRKCKACDNEWIYSEPRGNYVHDYTTPYTDLAGLLYRRLDRYGDLEWLGYKDDFPDLQSKQEDYIHVTKSYKYMEDLLPIPVEVLEYLMALELELWVDDSELPDDPYEYRLAEPIKHIMLDKLGFKYGM